MRYPVSFQIEGRELSPPLILSPMAGVTDSPFRRIAKKCGGLGLIVTEFISVEGLTRGNLRSHEMMRYKPEERPIAIQIFGYDEVRMRWAAEIAQEAGADFVDINCGCPAKKVVNGGGGSNLLRDLPQLKKILTEVKRAITIPMTVKIRAGWDDKSINCVEVAKLIEDCGGSMVTLHGRTRVQGYKGWADWDLVREIKRNVSIPVSGSGDILKPEDAMRRFDETGCNAVHIGRGAIANPYIFRQTWETMNGLEPYQPPPREMHELLLEFRDNLREHMPERGVIGRMKMLSAQFLRGVPGGAHIRTAVLRSPTVEEMEPLFEEYFALAEIYGIDADLQSAPDEQAELAECGVQPFEKSSLRGKSEDSHRAADLIPKGFKGGFGIELIGSLKLLRRIEPEPADKLLCRALSEIQPNPENPMADLFAMGYYFIPEYGESESHTAGGRNDDPSTTSETIKPGLIEPLLNFAFKAMTIESAIEQKRMSGAQKQKRIVMFDMIDQGIVLWLLPLFELHQPERAAFIRSYLGQIENALPTTVRQAMNTPRPTTVKELLEEAQTKKQPDEKDSLYAEAARKAQKTGDFDQAISITEMLSDKRMGTDISSIRYSGAINASDKGDFDLAYRYAKEISDPFDRAKALCRIALNSFQMRDLQRANELINEAEKLIAKSGPAPNKLWGLLDIAAAKATIDPASGFEAVNSAIEVLNQFYYTKSQPVGRDFIRDSAIFDENLGALSRTDFQRALRLALSINQSDISTMAQLAVCRGVLERHD